MVESFKTLCFRLSGLAFILLFNNLNEGTENKTSIKKS